MSRRRRSSPAGFTPRISMISLGCAKNTVDAEMALALALEGGFDLAIDPVDADIVLINTCGFIQPARDEAADVIREILDLKKRGGGRLKVAVMGCLAERSPLETEKDFAGIDAIWGLDIFATLPQALKRLMAGGGLDRAGFGKPAPVPEGPRLLSTPASYAYLKISDGCDNRCAYCAIPDIRGHFRSRQPDAVVEEARVLAGNGVGELVVISQDTTYYGRDRDDGVGIAELLERLLAAVDTPRIRLLYAHPAHFDNRLADMLCDEPRLCRYLDIPFQHVSERVLGLMGRHYGADRIQEILERFDNSGLTLRTTLLTGFPGEREEDFLETLQLVDSGRIQHVGVFAYSPEQGTPAYSMPDQVPAEEAERRRDLLLTAQRDSAFDWLDSRIGGEEMVLVDRRIDSDWVEGRTIREAPDADGSILLEGAFQPGDHVSACIAGREGYDLLARAAQGHARKPERRSRRGK